MCSKWVYTSACCLFCTLGRVSGLLYSHSPGDDIMLSAFIGSFFVFSISLISTVSPSFNLLVMSFILFVCKTHSLKWNEGQMPSATSQYVLANTVVTAYIFKCQVRYCWSNLYILLLDTLPTHVLVNLKFERQLKILFLREYSPWTCSLRKMST